MLVEMGISRHAVAVLALAACGGGGGGGNDVPADGPAPDVAPPIAHCDAPGLAVTSSPTTIIGDGTPASCTEEAFRQAAAIGGVIVFDCGSAPVTIAVTSRITIDT